MVVPCGRRLDSSRAPVRGDQGSTNGCGVAPSRAHVAPRARLGRTGHRPTPARQRLRSDPSRLTRRVDQLPSRDRACSLRRRPRRESLLIRFVPRRTTQRRRGYVQVLTPLFPVSESCARGPVRGSGLGARSARRFSAYPDRRREASPPPTEGTGAGTMSLGLWREPVDASPPKAWPQREE